MSRRTMLAVAFAAFSLIIHGCRNENPTKQGDEKQAVVVDAVTLIAEYASNEAGADRKYKGKSLEVSGAIERLGQVAGPPFVAFRSGNHLDGPLVQCFFTRDDEITTSNLYVGKQIKVRGLCMGRSANIVLNNCEVR